MMAEFTKGLWKSGGCVVWQVDGDMICDLSMALRNPDETEANAQLIAAAPELYEACYKAFDWLNRFRKHASITFGGGSELVGELFNALAKARGGTNA